MLLPREELEKLGILHPEIEQVCQPPPPPPQIQRHWFIPANNPQHLKDNPRPKVDLSDASLMRAGMAAMEKGTNADLAPLPAEEEFYHAIPMRDGFNSTLKILKPAAEKDPGPLVVLVFGGGFVGGTVDQLTKTARALRTLFGATVVSISYRLAPEWKFPYAQHDTEDSMKWIAAHATDELLVSDPQKGFLMGGVSAGGALTAAFSRIFQDSPLAFPLTGQWLCIPSVMDPPIVPEKYRSYHISSEQFASGAFFSRETREWLHKLVQHDIHSPLRYAINSTSPLEGQPKTYFQVDGMDPLRDDGLIYEEMLKEAGVPTKINVYPGCPHGHFAAFPSLKVSKEADVDTVVGFGWLLGREIARDDAAKALGM